MVPFRAFFSVLIVLNLCSVAGSESNDSDGSMCSTALGLCSMDLLGLAKNVNHVWNEYIDQFSQISKAEADTYYASGALGDFSYFMNAVTDEATFMKVDVEHGSGMRRDQVQRLLDNLKYAIGSLVGVVSSVHTALEHEKTAVTEALQVEQIFCSLVMTFTVVMVFMWLILLLLEYKIAHPSKHPDKSDSGRWHPIHIKNAFHGGLVSMSLLFAKMLEWSGVNSRKWMRYGGMTVGIVWLLFGLYSDIHVVDLPPCLRDDHTELALDLHVCSRSLASAQSTCSEPDGEDYCLKYLVDRSETGSPEYCVECIHAYSSSLHDCQRSLNRSHPFTVNFVTATKKFHDGVCKTEWGSMSSCICDGQPPIPSIPNGHSLKPLQLAVPDMSDGLADHLPCKEDDFSHDPTGHNMWNNYAWWFLVVVGCCCLVYGAASGNDTFALVPIFLVTCFCLYVAQQTNHLWDATAFDLIGVGISTISVDPNSENTMCLLKEYANKALRFPEMLCGMGRNLMLCYFFASLASICKRTIHKPLRPNDGTMATADVPNAADDFYNPLLPDDGTLAHAPQTMPAADDLYKQLLPNEGTQAHEPPTMSSANFCYYGPIQNEKSLLRFGPARRWIKKRTWIKPGCKSQWMKTWKWIPRRVVMMVTETDLREELVACRAMMPKTSESSRARDDHDAGPDAALEDRGGW